MKKRTITIFVIVAFALNMIIPTLANTHAIETETIVSEAPPVIYSRGGTIEPDKIEFTVEDLKELFPSAEIDNYDDLEEAQSRITAGIVPDASKDDTVPIQRFTHEFEDGSSVSVDVYPDRSFTEYGVNLGTVTIIGGNTEKRTNSLVYYRVKVSFVTLGAVEYYVTHTRGVWSNNAEVLSDRLHKQYIIPIGSDPAEYQTTKSGGNGFSYVQYNVWITLNIADPGDGSAYMVPLKFNASTLAVSY